MDKQNTIFMLKEIIHEMDIDGTDVLFMDSNVAAVVIVRGNKQQDFIKKFRDWEKEGVSFSRKEN